MNPWGFIGCGAVVLLSSTVSHAAGSSIADAVMAGDLASVRTLLNQHSDVNARQPDGSTALHWAVYRRDVNTARLLVRAGAGVTVATREGATPLSLASENGDGAMIEMLLQAGADPNERLGNGTTPLMMAARTGVVPALRVLLDHKADVNATEELRGTTALMWAAGQGHPNAVKILIEYGANLNDRSNTDAREISYSMAKGNAPVEGPIINGQVIKPKERVLGLGVLKKFEQDGGGLTPLVFAARRNDLESVRMLVEAGADIDQVTNYGWSPLLVATQNRHYQLGAFLLDYGADPNIANNGGWTPLYLAVDNRNIEGGDYPVRKPDVDHLDFIRILLEHGADVNARVKDNTEVRTVFAQQWLNEDGATAFLRAAQSSDLDVMKLLLANGADPKIPTKVNVDALQVASGIGWVEGITYEWSEQANVEAVQLLLELGLDPNAVAETGRTALHGAALKGRPAVIQLLANHGAKLDARDYGMTGTERAGRLELHTWQPVDYADGLVRIGTQSAIARPQAGQLLRKLMEERGIRVPPAGRTYETVCLPPDVCDDVRE